MLLVRHISAPAGLCLLLLAAVPIAAEEGGPQEETVASPPPPAPAEADDDGLFTETLDNGLHVIVMPDPELAVVATQVWYNIGAVHEPPGQFGMAHLFEHMMFHATEHDSQDALWRWHHEHGGRNNGYTNYDRTVYISEIAPEFHDQVLVFEANRMAHLTLTPEGLANEKKIVSEELRAGSLNDPYQRVMTAARKAVLGDHPYGHEIIGTLEDVEAATLESCLAWYERYYRADNAALVIVGPVDGAATLDRVRELYADVPGGSQPPPPVPSLMDWELPQEVEVREDLPPVVDVITAYPLPGSDSDDLWALQLMLKVLAYSWVQPFDDVYTAAHPAALDASVFAMGGSSGSFLIFNTTHLRGLSKKTTYRWQDAAREKMADLHWLTEERLAAAKRKMTREELDQHYFAGRIAAALGECWLNYGDEHMAFEHAEHIEAVTLEDVGSAYRRYIVGGTPVRVRIIPE